MKSLFTGLILAICIAFSGCEKTTVQQAAATTKKASSNDSHEKAPLIQISAVVGYMCGSTTPCGATSLSITKSNKLQINNDYQSFYPSLTYTIYKRTSVSGSVETYTGLGQYTCSDHYSYYASGLLDNGAKILIFANDPSGAGPNVGTPLYYDTSTSSITNYPSLSAPSAYIFATMGNYKGESCTAGGGKG